MPAIGVGRRRRPSRAPAIEQDGHRTVVHETDLHYRLELTGRDRRALASQQVDQVLVGGFRLGRRSGCEKRRAPALTAVREQRELRDREYCPTDVTQREVDAALGILEDAQVANFPRDVVGVAGTVPLFDAHERDDAAPDRANLTILYRDPSTGDALQDCSHSATGMVSPACDSRTAARVALPCS